MATSGEAGWVVMAVWQEKIRAALSIWAIPRHARRLEDLVQAFQLNVAKVEFQVGRVVWLPDGSAPKPMLDY